MGRLLSELSGDSEPPSLSTILEEEILQVDRQLVDIQTSAEELSGFYHAPLFLYIVWSCVCLCLSQVGVISKMLNISS